MLEILAPRECLVCGELIASNPGKFEFLCKKCELFLPAAPDSEQILNRFYQNFHKDDVAISHIHALFSVSNDRDYLRLIHGLKYYGFKRVGKEFGVELANKILQNNNINYQAIVPIPIHHARFRERGYNQSLIIAKALSKVLGIPVAKPIKRIKYTTTQTLLSKDERKTNIQNTIVPKNKKTSLDGNYLLIDDVLTTGSTMNVSAQTLLNMGAARVDSAVLAVA